MGKETGILLNNETCDLQVIVKRNSTGVIEQGMVVGLAMYQNQAVILNSGKGEFKEFPTFGVGIADIVGDHDPLGWRREITTQLAADGFDVSEISMNNQKLYIDADYHKK